MNFLPLFPDIYLDVLSFNWAKRSCFLLPKYCLLDSLFKSLLALNIYSWFEPWILPVKTESFIKKDKPVWRSDSCLWGKCKQIWSWEKREINQSNCTSTGHGQCNYLKGHEKERNHWCSYTYNMEQISQRKQCQKLCFVYQKNPNNSRQQNLQEPPHCSEV